MDIEIETENADRTREVGRALASLLQPRDTVVLTGDLGAGKTVFAQGLLAGLGVFGFLAVLPFAIGSHTVLATFLSGPRPEVLYDPQVQRWKLGSLATMLVMLASVTI